MRRFFLKLIRRRSLQQDLEAEMAFHRQMAEDAGDSIPYGHTSTLREQALDLWRFNFIENLWRDMVYGVRSLRKSPALVLSAVLSLTLGIGANAAIFSLAVEFLLSEPSVRDGGSIVYARVAGSSHAKPEVLEFIRRSGLFADVTGVNEQTFVNWNDGRETKPIFGSVMTKNLFSSLGIPVEYGRGILLDDPTEVVVLSHYFWSRHYNSDPGVVGRSITLNGRAYTVVGVLPRNYRTLTGFGYSPDICLPPFAEDTDLAMYARLKPGMSAGEAEAGLRTVATHLDEAMPIRWKYSSEVTAVPVAGFSRVRWERQLLTVGLFFVVLLIVVGLVLLIACVNVAGLLLARASARRREIAIRLSLGAGRARLLQQLMVESLLLALAGTACGLLLARVIATTLASIQLPLPIPVHLNIEPDWRVAVYAAGLLMVTTLACGLLPAVQSVRESVSQDLRRENRMRLRRVLVGAQIAVSMIVLTTGMLFARNLMRAGAMSPGFDVTHTVRAEMHLPPVREKDPQRVNAFVETVLPRLRAIPGVEAAAGARIIPFTDSTTFGMSLNFSGRVMKARFNWNAVTPDYFAAMDIPLKQGRTFAPTDRAGAQVVIVNETFAKRYVEGHPVVGATFLWGDENKVPYQIAGVVGDTKNMSIGEDAAAQLYEPLAQVKNDRTRIQFVLRSAIPPAMQLDAVRKVLRDIEPAAGTEVETLYSSIGLAFLPSQVGAVLMGSMGLLGLLLAAVGLYGTMIYSVTRRTREIGIRMAIGAGKRAISRMVLMETMKLVVWGSAIGLVIAWFVTKPMAMFLVPGLRPSDPLTYAGVLVVLGVTALAASWAPLRKAVSVDPAESLRYE